MLLFSLLQIGVGGDTTAVATNVAEGTKEMSLSFWDLAVKGGWIMIPIALLSVIAVYIFVERYIKIQKAAKSDIGFMDKVKENILSGKVNDAKLICQSIDSPLARMIEKGIIRIGKPLGDVNAAIENVGKLEIARLEKGLPALATVSGAAPMIGFLGTVMGMIRAFYDMATVEGGNINVSVLSNGIYTAMVTTVAGLIVGIIAYLAYNILVAKVEKVVYLLEATTTEFMDMLNEPAN